MPRLLSRTKLEGVLTPAVRAQTKPDVVVDCGPAALQVRPADGVVWCAISPGGQHAKIEVEIDDKLNVQHWKVTEPPG